MQAVIDVVLPIFAIILIGFLAGRHNLLGPASSDALNRFVYYIAVPVLLFHALARTKPAQIFDVPFLSAARRCCCWPPGCWRSSSSAGR